MVLHSLLKHFLHRARTARREHNTPESYRQDRVLANAIVKILRNVRGKGSRRLMTVEPRGNAQTVIPLLRISPDHLESRLQPPLILESRSLGQYLQRFIYLRHRSASHPSPQMSSLHHTRSATRHHQRVTLREFLAQLHHLPIFCRRAQHSVATHHTHHLPRVIPVQEFVQIVSDGKVVQGPGQHLHLIVRMLSLAEEMLIHLHVVTAFALAVLHHLPVE